MIKTLLFDRTSRLGSSLVRMAPGAVLTDQEPVMIAGGSQGRPTRALRGTLEPKAGPDRPAG